MWIGVPYFLWNLICFNSHKGMLRGSRAHCLYISKENCAIYTYIFWTYQYFLQYMAHECETKFIMYEWQMYLNVKDKWNCKLGSGRSCEGEVRPKKATSTGVWVVTERWLWCNSTSTRQAEGLGFDSQAVPAFSCEPPTTPTTFELLLKHWVLNV